MSKAIYKRAIAWLLTVSVMFWTSANAGVDEHFGDMFDSLLPNTNVSEPGAYMSARRGVISGGEIEARTQIMDINLLSVTPPSFQAGCNGISLHGGALSFINGEEFQNLLRQIAANSVGLLSGYAFNMALDAMCEKCSVTINDLAKKINDIAHSLKNSCEAAKRLTASAPGYMDGWADDIRNWAGIDAANSGTVGDPNAGLFSSITDFMSKLSDKLKSEFYGNVTWKVMNSGFSDSFATSLDAQTKAFMMAVFGSIVTSPKSESCEGEICSTIIPSTIDVQDLIDGGSLRVYSCGVDLDECKDPELTTTFLRGFKDRVQEFLLGKADQTDKGASTIGVIAKMRSTNVADVLTDKEKAFIAAMKPQIFGLLAENANRRNVYQAFQQHIVDVVATEMAISYLSKISEGLRAYIAGRKDKGLDTLKNKIYDVGQQFSPLRLKAAEEMKYINQALEKDAEVKKKIKEQFMEK